MTDADVDGAHIAALLITFFYRYTPALLDAGRLYMAMPNVFTGRGKIELGRFKGLGEMMASQLKVTTMDKKTRRLARITIDDDNLPSTEALVETLMGKRSDFLHS